MQTQWNPLSWASEHWTQISVAVGLGAGLYRIHRVFTKIKNYLKSLVTAQESIELIKVNHLPHLQAELVEANRTLLGIREDNKILRDDLRVILTRMN